MLEGDLLVSVIIPARNESKTIARTIKSVQKQTHDQVEILVCDDGSTDDTVSIAKKYLPTNCVLTQEQSGASVARNNALKQSNGDWVLFLDADDELTPNAISSLLGAIPEVQNENLAIVGGVEIINSANNIYRKQHADLNNFPDQVQYLIKNNVNTPSVLHCRESVEIIKGFRDDLERCQEYDLHLRLALNGVNFVCISDLVARCYYNVDKSWRSPIRTMEVKSKLLLDFLKTISHGPNNEKRVVSIYRVLIRNYRVFKNSNIQVELAAQIQNRLSSESLLIRWQVFTSLIEKIAVCILGFRRYEQFRLIKPRFRFQRRTI